jgi:hypothetical protein
MPQISRPWFDLWAVLVEFVVKKVALGQYVLQKLWSSCQYYSNNGPQSFIHLSLPLYNLSNSQHQ